MRSVSIQRMLVIAAFVALSVGALRVRGLDRFQTVPDVLADELVGGVDCAKYGLYFCGDVSKSTCPATAGYTTAFANLPKPAKPSNSVWCGCVTSCANQKIVQSIYTCGSM